MPLRNLTIDILLNVNQRRVGGVWFDKPYTGSTGKLYLLRLTRCFGVNGMGEKYLFPSLYYGLVMQSTGKPGEYRRIGFAQHISLGVSYDGIPVMDQKDPWAAEQKQTIVIR
ncbi:hypothetical protein B0T16DRAFT_417486 [Cercophora newfieldiana]|uniref:Uncharacterized protein n=1 Tax=Cercophora newfieldiana TaxID=92897 RepID=A0AA39Y1Q5_9PEZI|nr:hypothetical protein B0T16DRAFT_417486 [Cercophora newfieldiana]